MKIVKYLSHAKINAPIVLDNNKERARDILENCVTFLLLFRQCYKV